MKRKLNSTQPSNTITQNNHVEYNTTDSIDLMHAIHVVEDYVFKINPRNYSDIKAATKNITKAAIGAYLSVHSTKETLEYLDELGHSLIDDIFEYEYDELNKTIH